jgi:hypothetical protein
MLLQEVLGKTEGESAPFLLAPVVLELFSRIF